jgi:hypothetical protein
MRNVMRQCIGLPDPAPAMTSSGGAMLAPRPVTPCSTARR